MVRGRPEQDEVVLVLSTLGAPERRRLRGRRGKVVRAAEAEPVPTGRATVVRTEPFASEDHAATWLAAVRGDEQRRQTELTGALETVNAALRAHRAAHGDPYARDVGVAQTLVARVGYGSGDEAVAGMFRAAWELPRAGARGVRRSMEAPEERFAALLGRREPLLACEELVLRARSDLDAGRTREAALQARIALEALLAELPSLHGERRGPLEADRGPIGAAANAALAGELSDELARAAAAAVERMEAALRARRLGG